MRLYEERESASVRERTYSVAQLAKMAHLTDRALRYYDQIGLLVPARDPRGYRAYRQEDVRRLQHILLLRACNVPLGDIASALTDPAVDIAVLLEEHLASLEQQKHALDRAIAATQRSISGLKEFREMNDEEKFAALKQASIERFEEEYGQEARERYGDDAIDEANERMRSMSKLAWDAKEELEQRIKDALVRAMETGDPSSSESRMMAELHAQWIRVHWGEGAYTPEAHVQLAEGYLKDARFIEYYDSACGEGATEFLRDVIVANIAV